MSRACRGPSTGAPRDRTPRTRPSDAAGGHAVIVEAPARPRVCAGWLLRGADGNPRIRELLRTGELSPPELPAGMELYDSYTEMAVANGVDPRHPALHAPARPPSESDLLPPAGPAPDHGTRHPG